MNLAIHVARETEFVYRAWCPALPGCVVHAESANDARRQIRDAVRGYLAHLDETLPRELGRLFRFRGSNTPQFAHA